jgi:hypothetical protein
MFVNISPADWNLEESQTSLYYASRVKQITNESIKNVETREMTKMRKVYREMQKRVDELEVYIKENGLELPNEIPLLEKNKEENEEEEKD